MDGGEAYGVLGIDEGASREEIESAYRRAAKLAHPDVAGGDRDRWDLLIEARDLLLGARGGDLVPVHVAVELARVQEKALIRIDERHERAGATQGEVQSVVRRHTSNLDRRQRAAWAAGIFSGGIALAVAVLRAVVLTGPSAEQNAVFATMIAVFALAAAGAGAVGFVARTRAEHLRHMIEDVTNQLSQRAQYLRVLTEIRQASGREPPWEAESFDEAIDEWTDVVGRGERASLAFTASRIGPRDFGRLVVAKGLELGVLEEATREVEGLLIVSYGLADLQQAGVPA
jgi:DnaJ-like protein